MAYIVYQIVPFVLYLSVFDKEERKRMDVEDWMFAPLIGLLILMPAFGAIIGLMFQDEDSKPSKIIAMASIYIIIIGMVITFLTM